MGTKNNPGRFDCYDKADPDEPMFVLLGRDTSAATLIRVWAAINKFWRPDKATEALICADAMERWCKKIGRTPV